MFFIYAKPKGCGHVVFIDNFYFRYLLCGLFGVCSSINNFSGTNATYLRKNLEIQEENRSLSPDIFRQSYKQFAIMSKGFHDFVWCESNVRLDP